MPAIKLRYGAYSDFVPSKLLPAEVGVVQTGDPNTTDGVAIYICAKNGTVKRFTTSDDLTDALTDLLDDTLSVQDKAAEAAAVGTAIQNLVDATLTQAGKAADAKATGDEIADIKSDLDDIVPGLSDEAKAALLDCFAHVAWSDEHGQNYYDALENALRTLTSISADFNQGQNVIYANDSLDTLRQFLTVTAIFDDETTKIVNNYNLSGILTEGTSVITASYDGKTATFNVSVTAVPVSNMIHNWDFTQSLVDSISGETAVTNGTRNSNGLSFYADSQYIDFGLAFSRNRTYEIDIDNIGSKVGSTTYRRLFAFGENGTATASNTAALVFGRTNSGKSGWWWYLGSSWDASPINAPNYSSFDGKTLKIYIDNTGKCFSYAKTIGADDSTYVSVGNSKNVTPNYTNAYVYMGGSSGDSLANALIKAFRVYEGEK